MSRRLNCNLASSAGAVAAGTKLYVEWQDDEGALVPCVAAVPEPGRAVFTFEDCALNGGANVTVMAPGGLAWRGRQVTPPTGIGAAEGASIQLQKESGASPFPPESGRLRAVGPRLVREDGSIFAWRGATQFLLFARYLRGEDISGQIAWLQTHGVNVARVFAPGLSWGGDWDFFKPFSKPVGLHDFFGLLAAAGIRCEFTVLTGGGSLQDQRAQVQWAYDVAAVHPLVMIEIANEPDRNGVDVGRVAERIDRRGVLSASGDYPVDAVGGWGDQGVLVLDYCTPHIARVHDRKYARNSKDLFEIQEALNVPVVGDEPIGFGEGNEPGRRIDASPAHIQDTIAHFAIAHLFTAGGTIHSQAGIEAIVPAPGSQQAQLWDAVTETWQRIPAQAQTGAYTRPGLGAPFPVRWRDEDSLVTHAYASILGDDAWVVNPAPRPGWTAQAVPGWQVAESWPPDSHILTHLRRTA